MLEYAQTAVVYGVHKVFVVVTSARVERQIRAIVFCGMERRPKEDAPADVCKYVTTQRSQAGADRIQIWPVTKGSIISTVSTYN